LDGPGVRDVLNDVNGRMLAENADEMTFVEAIKVMVSDREGLARRGELARESVRDFGLDVCADRILELYQQLIDENVNTGGGQTSPWDRLLNRLEIEWNLLVEKTTAIAAAVVETEATRSHLD